VKVEHWLIMPESRSGRGLDWRSVFVETRLAHCGTERHFFVSRPVCYAQQWERMSVR
jgi:hypothetical protein